MISAITIATESTWEVTPQSMSELGDSKFKDKTTDMESREQKENE